MAEPIQKFRRYRSGAAGSQATAAEGYAGHHRSGRHRRADRHRQSLQPGERQQEGCSGERVADAPGRAQRAQVNSFETQQQLQARRDAEERQRQQELAAAMQQLQAAQAVPGPEAAGAPPMTPAQRAAIYGDSPNARTQTSNMSQAQAEAKQKALAREKQQQDAINSDTVAIDFAHAGAASTTPASRLPPCLVNEKKLPSRRRRKRPLRLTPPVAERSRTLAGHFRTAYQGRR